MITADAYVDWRAQSEELTAALERAEAEVGDEQTFLSMCVECCVVGIGEG